MPAMEPFMMIDAAVAEERQGFLDGEESAADVEVEDLVEVLFGDFDPRAR